MDKKISELFLARKILCKNIEIILDFQNLKTYKIFLAVDMKNFYNLIFIRSAKSRFLTKDAQKVLEICQKIEEKREIKIKKRTLFYSSSLCSKAKALLQNWKLYDFV